MSSSRGTLSRKARRRTKRMRFGITLALLGCLIVPAAYAAWPYAAGYSSMNSASQHVIASPRINMPDAPDVPSVSGQAGTAFPLIDWEALRAQNPDVVAWVTVPGTSIDYPVVQASPNDPQFYLAHDINKNDSLYGCPYLDADVAALGGTNAPFPVIYGHHLINGLMFSNFARFADEAYAAEHRQVLLMTPDENKELEVIGVNVVDADVEKLQVAFESEEELTRYLAARLSESEVVLPSSAEQPLKQVFCFVTCSYGSDNERTLVYAVERDPET